MKRKLQVEVVEPEFMFFSAPLRPVAAEFIKDFLYRWYFGWHHVSLKNHEIWFTHLQVELEVHILPAGSTHVGYSTTEYQLITPTASA